MNDIIACTVSCICKSVQAAGVEAALMQQAVPISETKPWPGAQHHTQMHIHRAFARCVPPVMAVAQAAHMQMAKTAIGLANKV